MIDPKDQQIQELTLRCQSVNEMLTEALNREQQLRVSNMQFQLHIQSMMMKPQEQPQEPPKETAEITAQPTPIREKR